MALTAEDRISKMKGNLALKTNVSRGKKNNI